MIYLPYLIIIALVFLLIKTQEAATHNGALGNMYMVALIKELGVRKGMESFFIASTAVIPTQITAKPGEP